MKAINLSEKLALFDETWHPRKIANVDESIVILTKVQGEFIWHSHEQEDELFLVLGGTLHMQFRDRTELVRQGEMIVVPKGVEHCPMTMNGEVVDLLLFEKATTAHTGNVVHTRTVSAYPEI